MSTAATAIEPTTAEAARAVEQAAPPPPAAPVEPPTPLAPDGCRLDLVGLHVTLGPSPHGGYDLAVSCRLSPPAGLSRRDPLIRRPLVDAARDRLRGGERWAKYATLSREERAVERRIRTATRDIAVAEAERKLAEVQAEEGLAARLVALDEQAEAARQRLARAESEARALAPLVNNARAELERAVTATADELGPPLVTAVTARREPARTTARDALAELIATVFTEAVAIEETLGTDLEPHQKGRAENFRGWAGMLLAEAATYAPAVEQTTTKGE